MKAVNVFAFAILFTASTSQISQAMAPTPDPASISQVTPGGYVCPAGFHANPYATLNDNIILCEGLVDGRPAVLDVDHGQIRILVKGQPNYGCPGWAIAGPYVWCP